MTLRPVLAAVLVVALGAAACSGDDDGTTAPERDTSDVLSALADNVIIPSYTELVDSIDALETDVSDLCTEADRVALDRAQASWRDVATQWRRTRAAGVGPAMDRRLTAAIGFLARPEAIDHLLGGTEPVDAAGLRGAGAAVKGISALEVGLFGDGSDALATSSGARRCQYVASAAALAGEASAEVLGDWTSGYRATFVEGMDGDRQSSVDALVNEVIFRVTETDDQGLRALVEAAAPNELSANRADGPAAFHLADLCATLDGVAAVVAAGLGELVAARSEDTATRLTDAVEDAVVACDQLPDSVTDAFADPDATARAQEAVMALKILLSTEVASELGVTISFSDADGDS